MFASLPTRHGPRYAFPLLALLLALALRHPAPPSSNSFPAIPRHLEGNFTFAEFWSSCVLAGHPCIIKHDPSSPSTPSPSHVNALIHTCHKRDPSKVIPVLSETYRTFFHQLPRLGTLALDGWMQIVLGQSLQVWLMERKPLTLPKAHEMMNYEVRVVIVAVVIVVSSLLSLTNVLNSIIKNFIEMFPTLPLQTHFPCPITLPLYNPATGRGKGLSHRQDEVVFRFCSNADNDILKGDFTASLHIGHMG